MVIVFPFLRAGFSNIPRTFLISFEVQTRHSKPLKDSEQYIRDHLSGTKVVIWICCEYDAVFIFSYIFLCNLTKPFTLCFISFLSEKTDSEFSNSRLCMFLKYRFKVFINACKLASEVPIDWSFFLGV